MNRQQGAELEFASAAKSLAHLHWVEVEGGGINIGEDGAGASAHDRTG
jgi:hypothetical protein